MRTCILSYAPPATHGVVRLLDALKARGHEGIVLSPIDCSVSLQKGRASLLCGAKYVGNFDVVFPRCTAYFHQGRLLPRNVEAAAAAALSHNGAHCINSPTSKVLANDKILSLGVLASQNIPVPPTFFTSASGEVLAMLDNLELPAILKLSEGTWGTSVVQVDSEPSLRSATDAFFNLGHPLLIQRNLHRKDARHLRVVVLERQILASYQSDPRRGDFRSNVHASDTHFAVIVSDAIKELSIKSTLALGLEFAGVDLIENDDGVFVVEVNPAPGFSFADTIPGVDVATSLVVHAEQSILGKSIKGN
jgi:ribosomal protein S6--L-glutamate ligase